MSVDLLCCLKNILEYPASLYLGLMRSKSLQLNPFVCEQKSMTDIKAQPGRMMLWQNRNFHPCQGSGNLCNFRVVGFQWSSCTSCQCTRADWDFFFPQALHKCTVFNCSKICWPASDVGWSDIFLFGYSIDLMQLALSVHFPWTKLWKLFVFQNCEMKRCFMSSATAWGQQMF